MQTADHKDKIITMWRSGQTLQEIGDTYGVSRERIRQLLSKWDEKRENGGMAVASLINSVEAEKERIRRKREYIARRCARYGCTEETLMSLTYDQIMAFRRHKENARSRGIEFSLTLEEWVRIWRESGKLNKRGRTKGKYVMCRIGDSGPYSVDNVEIKTCSNNIKDYYRFFGQEHSQKVRNGKMRLTRVEK